MRFGRPRGRIVISTRFWLLLMLLVLVLALPAPSTRAPVGERPDVSRLARSSPSMQAGTTPPSNDLRAAGRVEIATAVERILSE